MQTTVVTLVGALLLLVPGFAVSLAMRLRWYVALVLAIPVTFGMVVIGSAFTSVAGIPWNPWSALVVLVVFVALAAAYSAGLAWRSRRRVPPGDAQEGDAAPGLRARLTAGTPWWALVSAGAGVLVGAGTIYGICLRGLQRTPGGTASLADLWDEQWHANLIRFIADTGIAAPTDLGRLFQVETHDSFYYPDAWHALGSLLMSTTGAGILPVINLWTITCLGLVVPLSAAALAWRLVRDRFSPAAAGIAAGSAGAVSGVLPSLPYVEMMTTANPNAVSAGMAGVAAVLIMSVVGAPGRVPLAAVGLVGIAGVHPSGAMTAALLIVVWWLFDALWRPRRGAGSPKALRRRCVWWRVRGRDLAALLSVGVIAGLILLPQIGGVLGNVGDIESHDFSENVPRLTAVHDAFTLNNAQTAPFEAPWVVLGLAVAGCVFLLMRRSVWMTIAWALLLLAAVDATESIGGTASDIVRRFSTAFYTDPRRIEYVIALVVVALAGAGIGLAIQGVRWAMRRWLPDRRYMYTGVLTLMLVAVPVTSSTAVSGYADDMGAVATAYRDGRVVSMKDRDALRYLSTLPHAYDTTVFVDPDQGLGWMYALEGLHPLFTHFDFPDPPGPRTWVLWDRLNTAGVNPRVDAALRELNIKYVVTSPPTYWSFQSVPRGLTNLGHAPGLQLVYDNGETKIFEVTAWRPPEPGEALYGWDPFADRSGAQPWHGPPAYVPAWMD